MAKQRFRDVKQGKQQEQVLKKGKCPSTDDPYASVGLKIKAFFDYRLKPWL